jgi:glycolate oxidase iron-sulfur subunit
MSDLSFHIDVYDRLLDCVHCGLCLSQCPTYAELGDENDSPRGRIHLMRSLADGRIHATPAVLKHLDLCLDCRACETACPSGVQYGSLIESARNALVEQGIVKEAPAARSLLERMMFTVMPYPRKLRPWLALGRLGQAIGLPEFLRTSGLAGHLPDGLLKLQFMLPEDSEPSEPLPDHAVPRSARVRARVALFAGCVSDAIFSRTNHAMHRVLLANDCEVFVPSIQHCCGAIHHHGGLADDARHLARANIDAFFEIETDIDAILVNVAGCGCILKDYAELLRDDPDYGPRARSFAAKVKDICEFLAALPLRRPPNPLYLKVTYHDPCHLAHGQKVRYQPREVLRSIEGLELIEMAESDWCCGAAGTYNLTQPEMSARLARRKLANIEQTGAEVVATGNAGCLMQLLQHSRENGKRYRIVHPIDLLDEAYGYA